MVRWRRLRTLLMRVLDAVRHSDSLLLPHRRTDTACESEFSNSTATADNLNVIGSRWTCDRVPTRQRTWVRIFDASSALLCAPNSLATTGDPLWFQQTLASPQRSLSVAICKDGGDSDEDIKQSTICDWLRNWPRKQMSMMTIRFFF
jgi:hypothetical protein